MQVIRLCIFTVILAVFVPFRATAADLFTIDRVPVDATGRSAAEAREDALARGRAQALRQLLRRLSPSDYWSVLPRIDDLDSVALVAGIQISNEKTSTTRYLADVVYSFDPRRIREILRVNQIPFSEIQARKAVLLPVLETDDGLMLWEEDNVWAARWKERNLTNELVPLLSPLGDLEDIVGVSATDAVSENWEVLAPFVARYGVGDAVLAKAVLRGQGERQSLLMSAVRLSSGTSEFGVPREVEVLVRNRLGLPTERLVDFGIDQILLKLQEAWKGQTVIDSDSVERLLAATIRFEGMGEWLAIQDRLSGMPTVNGIKIEALSLTGAEVLLRYVGSPAQLRIAMAQRDLDLLETDTLNLVSFRESPEPKSGVGPDGSFDDARENEGAGEFGGVEAIDIVGAAKETGFDEFPLEE